MDTPAIETAGGADRQELLDFLHAVFLGNDPQHPRFERLYPDLFPPDDAAAQIAYIEKRGLYGEVGRA